MTQYTILGRLRLMTALDDESARAALPYCAAALEILLPQLKQGVNPHDPRLDQAAAATALCMLLQRNGDADDSDFSSFKAGDITVTKKERTEKERLDGAEKLRAQAMAACRELLQDGGFFAAAPAFRRDSHA
jgi:hypothetical protein